MFGLTKEDLTAMINPCAIFNSIQSSCCPLVKKITYVAWYKTSFDKQKKFIYTYYTHIKNKIS